MFTWPTSEFMPSRLFWSIRLICDAKRLSVDARFCPCWRTTLFAALFVGSADRSLHAEKNASSDALKPVSLGSPNTDWICPSAVLDALAAADPAALLRYAESSR